MDNDLILVTCPTYSGKEYCFQDWLEHVQRIAYHPKRLFVVDNSNTLEFFDRWRGRVSMYHLDLPGESGYRRIALSMEFIRKWFIASPCQWWLNVESDIMAPNYIADLLTVTAREQRIDWLTIPYYGRSHSNYIEHGLGCCVFSRRMMLEETWIHCRSNMSPDGYWFDLMMERRDKWRHEVLRSAVELDHRTEPPGVTYRPYNEVPL